MTYLCLDVGERRTGVAVSDPLGILARPLTTLVGGLPAEELAADLRPILEEHDVGELIVGLPRRLSGAAGPEAEGIQALAARLRPLLGIPVHLWDERLSTAEVRRRLQEAGVRRRQRSKEQIDRLAAAVILQSWLDHRTATETRA